MADQKKKTVKKDSDIEAFDAFEKKTAAKKKTSAAKKTTKKKTASGRRTAAKHRKKKNKTPMWTWPAIVFSALILTGLGLTCFMEKQNYQEFIVMQETVNQTGFYPGIMIDGTDVTGRTLAEVLASAEETEQSMRDRLTMTMICGNDTFSITPEELDYHSNYEEVVRGAWQAGHEGSISERYRQIMDLKSSGMNLTVSRGYDETLLRAITDTVADELSTPARDAEVASFSTETLEFSYNKEQTGTYVDAEALYQTVCDSISSGEGNQTIAVAQETLYPALTVDELSSQMGMMAEAKTTATGTDNRLSNIANAMKTLNGVCVMPGETFSFNGTVGERTEAAGYKMAGAFTDGLKTEELGGGICQVSTTLFNAVAKSDLELIARSAHSRPVGYVDKGKDAAVSWPNQDFKFMNDTPYPVYIATDFSKSSGNVHIALYGKKLENGMYITIEAETLEELTDEEPVYIYTKDLPTGSKELVEKSRIGYYAESYRTYHNADGSVISSELYCRSTYPASGPKYRVGQ